MDPEGQPPPDAPPPAAASEPTLFHYEFCPHSRFIRLALAELGIGAALTEERPWEWRTEFLAINPAGEVPVLVLASGKAVCGAYAVSEYVNECAGVLGAKPAAHALFPKDPLARAEVRRLVDWFNIKMHRDVTREVLAEKVLGYVIPGQHRHPDPEILSAARENLRYHLSYVEHLADHRNWLGGEGLTIADFAAGAQLSLIDYVGEVPWESFPAAKLWYQRLKSRPAFRPLLSARIPGIPPSSCYANLDF